MGKNPRIEPKYHFCAHFKFLPIFCTFFFCIVNDIFDEFCVHFRINVFYHDLKTIKTSGFSCLDFGHEWVNQVFVDCAVLGCQKSVDVFDEILFALLQLLCHVIDRPLQLSKRGTSFLVKPPNV